MTLRWLILDELKSNSTDFDRLRNDVYEIKRLTQSGNHGLGGKKEVNLSSVEGNGTFCGKCKNCGKVCGYHAKECKKCKRNLHGGHISKRKGTIPAMVALTRHATSVE